MEIRKVYYTSFMQIRAFIIPYTILCANPAMEKGFFLRASALIDKETLRTRVPSIPTSNDQSFMGPIHVLELQLPRRTMKLV